MNEVLIVDDRDTANRKLTAILYALYALGFFTFVTAIAALVVNYIKLDDVRGTWLESHFRWQMRSFWFGLMWSALLVVFVVMTLGIGAFIAWLPHGVLLIWLIYRLVKGALYLNERKPMYAVRPG